MTTEKDRGLSSILKAAGSGEAGARDRLFDLVYEELRAIARHRLSRQRRDHTLQATDLVHEAWLRLVGPKKDAAAWPSRAAFFHAAATAMQRILIDHDRRKGAARRGGGKRRILTDVLDLAGTPDPQEILDLDEAIRRLEELDARLGQIVRLRFYTGLSVEETAEVLGITARTVRREWSFARARLYQALGGKGGTGE